MSQYGEKKDDSKVKDLTQKKLEVSAKIRELKAEAAKINLELARAGGDLTMIAYW
jgi:hypothetical protein